VTLTLELQEQMMAKAKAPGTKTANGPVSTLFFKILIVKSLALKILQAVFAKPAPGAGSGRGRGEGTTQIATIPKMEPERDHRFDRV
jgi:hypothetical protein